MQKVRALKEGEGSFYTSLLSEQIIKFMRSNTRSRLPKLSLTFRPLPSTILLDETIARLGPGRSSS